MQQAQRRSTPHCFCVATIIFASLVPRVSMATTFYVRATGSDMADGLTPTTAFASIGHAASVIGNPGDRVIVGPGTYVEGNIGPARSGIEGHPVEFLADPSGLATTDPAAPVVVMPPGDMIHTTGFLLLGMHHVLIDGFTILGASDAGIQIRSAVDGSANSSNVTIRNTNVRNCVKRGIDVAAVGPLVVEHNTAMGNGSSGISVQGCLSASPLCRAQTNVSATPKVSNNTIGTNGAEGIFLSGTSGAVVQNNVSFSNGTTGLTLRGVVDTLVVNNLVYANTSDGLGVGTEDLSAPSLGAVNTTILNNTVYGNGGYGLVIGNEATASPGGVVLDNIFQLNRNGGITLASASTCNYVAGFNINDDGYGPQTPQNLYDIAADPLFVNPAGADGVLGGEGFADDDFRLQQQRGRQAVNSPAVDAGAAPATKVGVTGSTASTGLPDVGTIDIGYHYDASAEQQISVPTPYMPLFVRENGNDDNDGRAPQQAVASIQEGARRALAGVTVIVGPGHYSEGDVHPVQNGGRVAFFADTTGAATGDFPGSVLVDAGGKDTAFVLLDSCSVVVDGFHMTGAVQAGIQVRTGSDGAQIRNNVAFSNMNRGIEVLGADSCELQNNLTYANGTGGIQLDKSQNSTVENNTSYGNGQDGILIGGSADSDAAPGSTVLRNVVADNAKGILAQPNSLSGYVTGFNVVAAADGNDSNTFAGFTPRADSDFIADPLLVNPSGPDGILGGTGFQDDDFHLLQEGSTISPGVDIDFGETNSPSAGSTRSDGLPDLGPLDAGYHYPFLPRMPQSVSASTVVFVRTTGSDNNSGTAPAAAFSSIRKALTAVSGGGIVIVGPGTYHESGLRLGGTDGTDGLPVLLGDQSGGLTGDPSGAVVLDAGGHGGPLVTGRVLIDGVQFTGAGRAPALCVLRGVRGVTVRNSTICGNGGDGLVTRGDNVNITNNLVCSNGGVGIIADLRRARGSTQLMNNTVAGNRAQGIVVRELANRLSYALVYNNITSTNGAAGLTLYALRGGAPPSGNNLNTDGYGRGTMPGAGDLMVSPQFTGGASFRETGCGAVGAFQLLPSSPAIDAGLGTATEIGLGNRFVTSTMVPDTGPVDLGYHYPVGSVP